MTRRAFWTAIVVSFAASGDILRPVDAAPKPDRMALLPYPQQIELLDGELPLGPADCETDGPPSATEQLAAQSLGRHLPRKGKAFVVRLGSVEEGYPDSWLTADQRTFLAAAETSPEASVLTITADGITVVGKSKWGMLYGVQTVNQLAIQAAREGRNSLPYLMIHDWPDARWRCLSPQLAWYAGWGARAEGFDIGNWSFDEWKWLADWSLLHKCNAWAICMYGKWPFSLPGYEEETLDFDSFRYELKTGRKTPYRYTHRNIKNEFLPELIRYANARGIKVHAYIGKNTFNGTYIRNHPEADAKIYTQEAIPFTPGVQEYWSAFLKRLVELGFNGFVFEDPEVYHVPNQNERCYKTFWEPWAEKYGFRSVAETDKNKPPLGVHVEYSTWLFRRFDQLIQKHAKALGRPDPEVYQISHILLNRIVKESKDRAERTRWIALIDRKHGRKVPFVLFEDNEQEYVALLGENRAATLGGRGGAAAGLYRIANINNDRTHGDLGMDLAEERDKQRRMLEAGGFGSMAYVFNWTNSEVFGYLGAQSLWRPEGVPGINNDDDFGFLDYAYRIYYGDEVGALAGRAYSVNSCVTEYQVFEDDPPTLFFGGPLHRDFQLLSVMADDADRFSQQAYKLFTGGEPDLYHRVYDPDAFRWDGYNPEADKLFKTERLRLLCVSSRRAKELCTAALASRKAKQLIAEGASIGEPLAQLDRAVKAARTSELLYFANYDDDYGADDNQGTRLREKLEAMRSGFLADCGVEDRSKTDGNRPVPDSVRNAVERRAVIDWEKQTDLLPEKPDAEKSGLYLSTDLGLAKDVDYYCVGGVFTVQAREKDGVWRTLFRRALLKKDAGWQHWDIPLDELAGENDEITLRLITDACSRAIDRGAPTWKWGYWGRPQLVAVDAEGERTVRYDLVVSIDAAKTFVRLDDTGDRREFDGDGKDSTDATFRPVGPNSGMPEPAQPAIAAFTPRRAGSSGVTVAEYVIAIRQE